MITDHDLGETLQKFDRRCVGNQHVAEYACRAASRNFTKAGVKRWTIAFSVTSTPSCAAVVW